MVEGFEKDRHKIKMDEIEGLQEKLNGGNGVLVCSENIKSRDENAPDQKLPDIL
jgi:hypothetical protein